MRTWREVRQQTVLQHTADCQMDTTASTTEMMKSRMFNVRPNGCCHTHWAIDSLSHYSFELQRFHQLIRIWFITPNYRVTNAARPWVEPVSRTISIVGDANARHKQDWYNRCGGIDWQHHASDYLHSNSYIQHPIHTSNTQVRSV